jgi:hypothetical protein
MAKKKKVVTKKKSRISVGSAAAIGAGVAAVGAGAYYFLGPKGKQHRGKAKVWMTEMETEVQKKLKKAKSVTQPLYQDAIDALSATYSKRYKEHASEINAFAKKLKGEWKNTRNKIRRP